MGAAGLEAKAQNLGRLEARRRQPAAPLWSVSRANLPFKAAIDASGIGRLSRTEPFLCPASASRSRSCGHGSGGSPCALLQRGYKTSRVGGWHGPPRHGTAWNHDVARTIALWRLQGLGASRRTLPPPPLDRGWEWVGAGMAVGASGSNQRSRTGLPGSTRPSCHLGGVQPGSCHPPWCGGARPLPDRNDGPGTAHRGGGQLALSLDPLGRGHLSLWLALFQCPWHMEYA